MVEQCYVVHHDFDTINKIGDFITPSPKTEMGKKNPFLAEKLSVDIGLSKQFSSQTVIL